MALCPGPSRLVIAGTGTQEANLHRLVEELDVGDRVQFAGEVADEELLALYAGALGVVYAPFDEDYGYVTLEAFLARKPVVTARDSGGPLEFVEDGVNGFVCDPDPEALAGAPRRLVIVGEGTQEANLRRLAEGLALGDRVVFEGAATDERLLDLYAGALGVVYTPFDEDYGYVTLEAFLARKPVVTARDSGGTLEFVEDGLNGLVCDPLPEALAGAFGRLAGDPARARALGDAGHDRARLVAWDGAIEKLVGE